MSEIDTAWAEGVVVREWPNAPPAWEVCRRLGGLRNVVFLDSALGGELGRYSFIAVEPFEWVSGGFDELEAALARCMAETLPGLPPFQGGAAGVFGYELNSELERVPRARVDEFGLAEMAVGLYDLVVAFDHRAGRAWKISTGHPEAGERRRERAQGRLAELERWLAEGTGEPGWAMREVRPQLWYPVPGLEGIGSSFTREGFLEAIRRGIEYVHAGDCFQVNLAQRLLVKASVPPLEMYGRLRAANPAPFAGYVDMGGAWLLSSSPERFVEVRAGRVKTRPIKGTRPRGATPAEDEARAAELLSSEKDRAENVMIVDLLRNDLGRVCEYGSVRVGDVCRLESYQAVHHLVSEVEGRLRPGLGPVDVLRAGFPGGSVTGAPKVRAMEIIAELEPTVRGPYCGCLGYVGFDGTVDTNILIRTMTMAGGWLQFPVGGGIVADSRAEAEYAETLHKAAGMLRAVGG